MYLLYIILVPSVATLTLLLFIYIKASFGLTCLECQDVPSARDCNTVKECGPHEVCYSTQVVSTSGHIYRKMGCRDRMQCTSGVLGKRSLLREVGDLPVCDGCCDSLWCQAKLCQDTDYSAGRGPICYNCEDQLADENCTHITECSRDDVCFESYKKSPSGHILRQTGCYGKLICDRVSSASNFHPTNDTCWNCCKDDICNTRCDVKKVTPTQASVSVVQTTQAACVDSTPEATCKLASSIVCPDIDHARNANLASAALYFVLVVICCVPGIQSGTYCFQCANVASAQDCATVVECGSHEVCYSTQIVSSTGRIYRKMGCRDTMQCSNGIVGKRSMSRGIGDLPVCEECCNSTLCQTKLCQDQDFRTDRGPMCFKCSNILPGDKCTQIGECARNDACFLSYRKSSSGHMLEQSECMGKTVCDGVLASPNFHPTNDTCFKCCTGDLCNESCHQRPTSSISAGITTQKPAAQSHCVDSTPLSTCKLASSIVCADNAHAQNAGCMHYCGFC